MPVGGLIRKGYLFKGRTLADLAQAAGIDPEGLEATVREYNAGARTGEDRQFGRGTTAFNRYLADPDQQPNPILGLPGILARSIGRDIEQVYAGSNKGILADVDLLQRITEVSYTHSSPPLSIT